MVIKADTRSLDYSSYGEMKAAESPRIVRIGTPVVLAFLFSSVCILNLNIRKKSTPITKGLLGNLQELFSGALEWGLECFGEHIGGPPRSPHAGRFHKFSVISLEADMWEAGFVLQVRCYTEV